MLFKVLGPLEVNTPEQEQSVSASMPRRVLATLLLDHNKPVSVSSLIEELWSSNPPRLARKTVQTYIYQLRKQLDGSGVVTSRIESRPRGYIIHVEPEELDLAQFEVCILHARSRLQEGEEREALEAYSNALTLWRGSVLSDLELGPILEPQVAHLTNTRLKLHEDIIDVGLSLGEFKQYIPHIRQLAADNPLHEGFHAQLMTALAGSGDRTGALDVYAALRDRMVENLGLDPSESLARLHQRVIDGSIEVQKERLIPGSARTRPTQLLPAQLPVDSPRVVGRSDLVDSFVSALEIAQDGNIPVAVVTGMVGIGKTVFANHAAHIVKSRFPDGQLFACLRDLADPKEVLHSFLRAAGVAEVDIPARLDDRAALYRSWTANRRVLVLLDDVSSTDSVLPLLPAGPGCLTIVTSRVGLPGLPRAETVALEPLSVEGGLELLRDVIGDVRVEREISAAREIVGWCEYLPVAIRAAGEKLVARPPWSLRKMADRLSVPHGRLEELVTRHHDPRRALENAYLRLAPGYRWALHRLIELGPVEFTVMDAARQLRTQPAIAECPIAELVDAHQLLLLERGTGSEPVFKFPELLRLFVESKNDDEAASPTPPESIGQWISEVITWEDPSSIKEAEESR